MLTIPSGIVQDIINSAGLSANGPYRVPYKACYGGECKTFFAAENVFLSFSNPVTGSVTITLDRATATTSFIMPIANTNNSPPPGFNVGSLNVGSVLPSGTWEWTSGVTGRCV